MDAYQTAVLNLTTAKARYAALVDAKGAADGAALAIGALQTQASAQVAAAQELVGTVTVGIKSVLTQRAEAQRLVGVAALIDAIKATPDLDPAAAQAAWEAAVAAVTPTPLENPVSVVVAIMEIAAVPDWAAFCALVVAGDRDALIAAVS